MKYVKKIVFFVLSATIDNVFVMFKIKRKILKQKRNYVRSTTGDDFSTFFFRYREVNIKSHSSESHLINTK